MRAFFIRFSFVGRVRGLVLPSLPQMRGCVVMSRSEGKGVAWRDMKTIMSPM